MNEEKTVQTNLADIKPVASSSVEYSLDEFHMKPTKIAKVEVQETNKGYIDNKWVDPLPVPQYQLFVESEVLKMAKDKEGKDIPFTAKEWFNLIKTKDGGFGWSTHEKGKLNGFLKAVKCSNIQELVGKPIIVKVVDKDQKDGTKIQLLRFMY